MRPGNKRLQRAELLRDHQRRVVRQHDPAGRRRGSCWCRRRPARSPPRSRRWRCRACCGAPPASSAGSPAARHGGRGRACCAARRRRSCLPEWATGRELKRESCKGLRAMGLYSIFIEHRLHGAVAAGVQAGETGSVEGGEAQHILGEGRRLGPGMADIDGLRAAVDCRSRRCGRSAPCAGNSAARGRARRGSRPGGGNVRRRCNRRRARWRNRGCLRSRWSTLGGTSRATPRTYWLDLSVQLTD